MEMTKLIDKAREYRELKRLSEEALKEANAIADELKSFMLQEDKDEIIAGEYKLSYKESLRTDIDKKALREKYKEIYDALSTETTYRRFLVH